MKNLLHTTLALTLVSCGGSSDINISGQNGSDGNTAVARNFSTAKYNENILGEFIFPEMEAVISNLKTISSKTSNCSADFKQSSVQKEWTEATLAYQRVRPVETSLLDRNTELSFELSKRYIGSGYSACDLQLNTADQFFLKSSLDDNPALNGLEALLFLDMKNTNHCSGGLAVRVDTWLSSTSKSKDLCEHIHFLSGLAKKELSKINTANKNLFEGNRGNEIFSIQALYNNIAAFIDQILKDDKVGHPLGLSKKCSSDEGKTCPTAVEHRASKITFESLSKNLEGVMAVYNSKTSMGKPQAGGLYQFLIANQKDEVANAFYNNIVEAHSLATSLHGQSLEDIAAALDGTDNKQKCFKTTVQNQVVPACALFASIKSLSDKVKKDLKLALDVSSNKQIEGDSD